MSSCWNRLVSCCCGEAEEDESTQPVLPSAGEGGYGSTMTTERPNKAFVIARHPEHGYLILKAFKNRKGLHGQLPGGKIDDSDPSPAYAAAREFFEETGLDLRKSLERLHMATFPDGSLSLKKRVYFRVEMSDSDQCGSRAPDSGEPFRLNLSHEHVGYKFVKDALRAAEDVALHSGGKNHTAMIHLECS